MIGLSHRTALGRRLMTAAWLALMAAPPANATDADGLQFVRDDH